MGSSPQQHRTAFELAFRPNVQLINVVRRFVTDFYDEVIGDPDVVSRLALATHELLENAVRYSTDGETRIRIGVEPSEDGDDQGGILTIRMENTAEDTHRDTLRTLFEEMNGAEDPMDHYCSVMRRNAKRQDGSGLGLARIRAEAEMSLDCEVEGELVTIIARTHVPRVPVVAGGASS
jgi:two-component sensor histidine kinase